MWANLEGFLGRLPRANALRGNPRGGVKAGHPQERGGDNLGRIFHERQGKKCSSHPMRFIHSQYSSLNLSMNWVSLDILEIELATHRNGFAVGLHVRVNEVIEEISSLERPELDVAPHGKENSVLIKGAKKVLSFFRVLPCFAGIHGNPPIPSQIELSPTVIPSNFTFSPFFG